MKKTILSILSIYIGFSAAAYAEVPSSPLRTYSQSLYHSNTLSTQLRSAFTKERVEVYTALSEASVWVQTASYDLDYYQNQAWIGAEWSPAPRFTSNLQFQYSWAANNHLDALTVSFHDLFGIDQNGRKSTAKHQFNIDSDKYNVHINDFEDEVMSKAVHGYLQYTLWESSIDAFSIGGSLYYNHVGSGPFQTSSFEQGIQANYSIINGPFSLFTSLGFNHRQTDRMIMNAVNAKDIDWSAAIGGGYRFNASHEMLLEYHAYEGIFKDDPDLSQASNEIILGYRYYLPYAAFEISMNENIINMDNTADIAFTAGLRLFL